MKESMLDNNESTLTLSNTEVDLIRAEKLLMDMYMMNPIKRALQGDRILRYFENKESEKDFHNELRSIIK